MKTAILLGLLTGSILAATIGQGRKVATSDASLMSGLPKKSLNLSINDADGEYCGGMSDSECASVCVSMGVRCYACGTVFCHCDPYGC